MEKIINLLCSLLLLVFTTVSSAQSYQSFRAAIPPTQNGKYPSMPILIDLDNSPPDFQITDVIAQNTVADTVFEMEILNVQTKHAFLSEFIDTVFDYNLFKNSNYKDSYDYVLFYIAFLPSKTQPKVVWEEVSAASDVVKKSYPLSNYFAYMVETLQLGVFKKSDWLNYVSPAVVLKRKGKYYMAKNRIFESCHIVSNAALYSPFEKGRKLNFYDRILKKEDLAIELKKRAAGGFSAYKPCYRQTDIFAVRQYFLEYYDDKQEIFHFYKYILPELSCNTKIVKMLRADRAKPDYLQSIDMPVDCSPQNFWANPYVGFIALDSPELQYDLGIKKPFEVKTVNGLSLRGYLDFIKAK